MLKRAIEKLENTEISFLEAIAGFAGIIVIRFFLENFSDPTPSFPAVPDAITLIHYSLFYAGAFLSLSLVLRLFIHDIKKVSKILLFGLPIIWLSPILDLITSHGIGYRMAYIFTNGQGLLNDVFTLGGSAFFGGITGGIKTEITAIVIGLFVYVFIKTKKIIASVLAALAGYLTIFAWLAAPSIIALIAALAGNGAAQTPSYFLLGQFDLSHMLERFIKLSEGPSYSYATETLFNLGLSYLLYLIDVVLLAAWAFFYRAEFLKNYLRNCRPGRSAYYFSLIGMGAFAAITSQHLQPFGNWMDVIAFLTLLIAYFCAWMFAVGVNDMVDTDIDRVSNKERPLIAGTITREEFAGANGIFLILAFMGGYLSGYWPLFTMFVFTAAYYIYSAPPLRLKRAPILSTFLIAIACLSAIAAGFYFFSADQTVSAFSFKFILLIIICFTLAANIKDIKDVEGDRAAGIATIPVLIKGYKGRALVGAMLAIAFLAVPIVFVAPALFVPSLVAACFGYYFVVAEPFKEWRIFALYFIYVAVLGIMLWR